MKFKEALRLAGVITEQDNENFEAFWITPKGKKISAGTVNYDDGDYYHADLIENNLADFNFTQEQIDDIYDESDYPQDDIVDQVIKNGSVRCRNWASRIDVEFGNRVGKKNAINYLLKMSKEKKAVNITEYTSNNIICKKEDSIKNAINYLVGK
jgi:hypothetical protein